MNQVSDQKDLVRMGEIFFAHSNEAFSRIRSSGTRFVHYTSAEAALSIIRHSQIWLRKSTTMNDFMEIEHGVECLAVAYGGEAGAQLKEALREIAPGAQDKLEEMFNAWLPAFRGQTYLTCLSEHENGEDKIGRLSMWRAYGGSAGVALVLNNTPFISESDVLNVYSSPVRYLDGKAFADEVVGLARLMRCNAKFLKKMGATSIVEHLFLAFRFAVLCTKHPGFQEEREWRIIHNPTIDENELVTKSVETIRGVPQPVMKVRLTDHPDGGLIGMEVPELLDRVIIGPTDYPDAIREAFEIELLAAGVSDVKEKVVVSQIPLRSAS